MYEIDNVADTYSRKAGASALSLPAGVYTGMSGTYTFLST